MKVSKLMNKHVRVCALETSLATAATLMWEGDCGVLPVVDADDKVVGMITDRDIAIAAATQSRPTGAISVAEALSGRLFSCRPNDDLQVALKTMRHARIHRLPVLNDAGRLEGILSANDIVLAAEEPHGKHVPDVTYEDAMSTLKAICEHRPQPQAMAQTA